jgi:tight adherence protein C
VTIILIAGLLLFAVAVTLFLRALTVPRARTVEALAQIPAYGYVGAALASGTEPAKSDARRSLDDLAGALGASVGRYIGSMREENLRKQLIAAGFYTTPPRRFIGYQLLAAIGTPVGLTWLLLLAGAGGGLVFVAILMGLVLGWMAPRYLLSRRARMRFEQVEYDLPELIDLLVVSVESGLGLIGSIRVASDRLTGPLGDEMKLLLHEQQLGLASDDSLRYLLDRCDTPGVRSFVRAIIQGEQLGVSVGQTLRNLALEMRKKRRQRAEERAQKAPVKVLFPLVFLIFPAIFVVILGPAIFPVLEMFGGAGG